MTDKTTTVNRAPIVSSGEIAFVVLIFVAVITAVAFSIAAGASNIPLPKSQTEVGQAEYLDLRLQLAVEPELKRYLFVAFRDGKITHSEYETLKVVKGRLGKRALIREFMAK